MKKANKVTLDGVTLIDLTADSVTPETLEEGVTAHDKSGAVIVGKLRAYDGTADEKNVFVISSIGYLSDEGMTWSEWVNSPYNTSGYILVAVGDIEIVTDAEENCHVNSVYGTTVIKAGGSYSENNLYHFSIDGVNYLNNNKHWYLWTKSSLFNIDGYTKSKGFFIDAAGEKVVEYDGDAVYEASSYIATIVDGAAYTTATLITITIGGTSYYAREGMTWYEWANSSYNTAGYICSGDTETDTVTDATAENVVQYNDADVYATDVLVDGAAYTTATISTEE